MPPSSGQNTSQLPHSLQKSAKLPIWCLRVSVSGVAASRVKPPPGAARSLTTGTVARGSTKVKLASLGHTGTHLSQVMQSNSSRRDPILGGGLLLAARR